MRKIILASQSPRRRELLTAMGVEFTAVPSHFDEQLDDSRSPREVSIELGLGKAEDVAQLYPDAIVIGSDTIVTIDGKQLAKPEDVVDAKRMLKSLAGREHDVTTSMVVLCKADGICMTDAVSSRVFFKPYDEQLVDQYVATGDPLDKAGAYGIQSGAAPLIDHIEGRVDTIMGFPTQKLSEMLAKLGIQSTPID